VTEHVSITCDGASNEDHGQKPQAKTALNANHYTGTKTQTNFGIYLLKLDKPGTNHWKLRRRYSKVRKHKSARGG
jgi:hypothetical protein